MHYNRYNMRPQELYDYLNEKGIDFEITEHDAVFTMEELEKITLPYPEWEAKNLFVRDDKKRNYYLITVKGEKRIDLKEFRKEYQLRSLSFASDQDLYDYLGLLPGSVTPLGLLNDKEKKVIWYLDEAFLGNKIGVHPMENTATVWLKTEDLISVIQENGTAMESIK